MFAVRLVTSSQQGGISWQLKVGIRAKVEHPFRVIKRQFGFMKLRYRGVEEKQLQLKTLFAPSNLWMARHQLMGAWG